MPPSEKEVARLEVQVEVLTARLDKLEPKIDTLLEFMSTNRGAWRALTIVAGASATVGGVIAWLVEHALKVLAK